MKVTVYCNYSYSLTSVYMYIHIYICICIYIYIYIYIYQASPNIDFLCVPIYASFCENYAKHYFDATKQLTGLIE